MSWSLVDRSADRSEPVARKSRYDFFISYAHEDRERVRELDRSLRDLLRRPFRRAGFNTFRDETALSAGGDLTERLRTAMQESGWLVVVLTEASARSHWVDREIAFWCEDLGRRDQLIIVRADHTVDLEWDEAQGGFVSASRLPAALVRAVKADPLYVDAPAASGAGWREATVRMAAAFLGRPPEEVAGEEYRLHRHRRRLARGAIVGLSLLTLASITAGLLAVRSSEAARRAQREAEENAARAIARQAQALGPSQPALALALSAEAAARVDEPETADVLQEMYATYGQTVGHLRRTLPTGIIVNDVAFNHDGTLVAVASFGGGVVTLWDARTGEEAVQLGDGGGLHSGWANTVAFSPDGRRLATGGDDRTAKIWDPQTGDQVATLRMGDLVQDVTFSPDGRRLATADATGAVRLWDAATGAEVATVAAHTGAAESVAFSPDGRLLASSGFDDDEVKLWDPATGEEIATLRPPGGANELAFSPDGALLASAGGDGTARLWDVATGDERGVLVHAETGTRFVFDVAFSPDSRLLATAGAGDTAKLWDAATGEEIATLDGHIANVTSVAFNHDGSLVATGSGERDGTTRLWDPTAGREIVELAGDPDGVHGLAYHPDGTVVATTTSGGAPRLWDPTTGDEVATLSAYPGSAYNVAFNHDGSLLATAGDDGAARLWDPATGDEVATLSAHPGSAYDVAFDRDGSLLATAGDDGAVRLWDPESGDEVATLAIDVMAVEVAFNHDGSFIAVMDDDGAVTLWDTARPEQQIARLDDHASGLAFSHHGRLLATAGGEGNARLLDAETGEVTATLRHTTGPEDPTVRDVAFSPDDRLLATAGADGMVKLWDVATGDEIATIPAHTDAINAVAFSPDGNHLATTSFDGTARVRRLVLTPAQACEVISAEVTRAELEAALGAAPRACTNLT